MKNRLIEQILENYNSYKNRILQDISDYEYRKKRYGVDYTIALFVSDENLNANDFKCRVRDTDKIIDVASNIIAVIFDFASEDGGLKAAENLMTLLEPKLFEQKLFVSVVNSHDMIDDDEHVRKVLDIVIDNINNGFDKIPENIDIEL